MSLRYKALIAAVLLVALVTGVLVWRAGQAYEKAERARIKVQLQQDAASLNDVLDSRAMVTGATLTFAARSSEVVHLFRDQNIMLADNPGTFAREWADAADADVALCAVDSFVAEDRKANGVLQKGAEISLCAAAVREGFSLDAAARSALATDAELNARLARAYAEAGKACDAARKAGKAAPAPDAATPPLVLGIGGHVYLVVMAPLYDSLQEYTVVGIAGAMIDLSSAWLDKNFRVSGTGDNDDDDADMTMAIHKIVFSAAGPTASTWPSQDGVRYAFDRSVDEGTNVFPFNLDDADDRFLGLRTAFDLAPADLVDRPGFIAFESLDEQLKPLRQLRGDISLLGISLGVLASLLAYLTAYSVIRRIRTLQQATVSVREGKFDTHVTVHGRDELSSLGKAFNDMTTGLKALGLYTHETLARGVLDNPSLLGNQSTREEGSIFFSDVKGFTAIAEKMGAEELTAQLNEYFTALGRELRETRGFVDKFIGDGIMAYWGKPFVATGDFAVRACATTLACLRVGDELRARWRAQGKPEFFQRIGVATGHVVVGNIGTDTKKNFTVIGDSVNLASRLEGANKVYGSGALVDTRTAELAAAAIVFREVDQVRVVGRQEPVRIFEPLARADDAGAHHAEDLARQYGAALAAYRRRDFAAAIELLVKLESGFPQDGPTAWLKQRCCALVESPRDAGWQPVTEATSK